MISGEYNSSSSSSSSSSLKSKRLITNNWRKRENIIGYCRRYQLSWKCLGFLTILMILFGATILGLSFLEHSLVEEQIKKNVDAQAVVTGKHSKDWGRFIDNYSEGANEYFKVWLYNLTNGKKVIDGKEDPIVNELGPYVFHYMNSKLNVNFTNDYEKVEYHRYRRWIFLPEESNGTLDDTITNMNPDYMGAVMQAGGELQLLAGYVGPALNETVFQFLNTEFLNDIVSEHSPKVLSFIKYTLVNSTNFTISTKKKIGDKKKEQKKEKETNESELSSVRERIKLFDSLDQFYSNWANATNGLGKDWVGMQVSIHSKNPSGITMKTASCLFDPLHPYSLTNTSKLAYQEWYLASIRDSNISGNNASHTLLKAFPGLTSEQLDMVLQWYSSSFLPLRVHSNLTKTYGVKEFKDLSYVQFGTGALTNGVSVYYLYPGRFPGIPEISIWYNITLNDPTVTLKPSSAKQWLDGPCGIFSVLCLRKFRKYALKLNITAIEEIWGLNEGDIAKTTVYLGDAAKTFTDPFLQKLFKQHSGLLATKTAHSIIFGGEDKMTSLAIGKKAPGMLFNMSNEMVARSIPKSTTWTGKNHLDKIAQYTVYQGRSSIDDIWAINVTVGGATQDGQFTPYLHKNSLVHSWDTNFLRVFLLRPVGMVRYRGIDLQRYMIENNTWLTVNPDFYNYIPGFMNLSAVHNGSTAFLSNGHMYGVDKWYRDRITGMHQDPAYDQTFIDVQKDLGKVLRAWKVTQVNLFLPNDSFVGGGWNNWFHVNVKTGIFFPIARIVDTGEMTHSDAKKIKDRLFLAIDVRHIVFYIMLSVGSCMVACCGVWCTVTTLLERWRVRLRARQRNRSEGGETYPVSYDYTSSDVDYGTLINE